MDFMANEMVPTLELDHSQLLATVRSQCDAVDRRFPGRGLAKVARQVHEATAHAPDLCDRIAIAYRGRIGQFRPADEVTEHDLMAEATRGPKSESGTGRG